MTQTIPCRAKNPATCKYHGAAMRMTAALDKGDFNAYYVAQQEMEAAAKTEPEAIEYFATQPQTDPAYLPHWNASPAQGLGAIKTWAKSKIAVGQDSTTPPNHHYATTKAFGKTITYLLDSDPQGNPRGIVGRIETSRGKSVTYNGNSLQGGNYLGSPTSSEEAFAKILEANQLRLREPRRR